MVVFADIVLREAVVLAAVVLLDGVRRRWHRRPATGSGSRCVVRSNVPAGNGAPIRGPPAATGRPRQRVGLEQDENAA